MDPFRINFKIKCGSGYNRSFYFISELYNINAATYNEEIDMGKYQIDSITDAYIMDELNYQNNLPVNFLYNIESKKLILHWPSMLRSTQTKLILNVKTKAHQREKLLNELFKNV